MPLGSFRLNALSKYEPPSGYTVPTAGFTDDANTRYLLKFDGNNTDTVGSGRTAKTVSTTGSPARSSSIFRFGTQSMQIPGSTTAVSIVHTNSTNADFYPFNKDFTLEYWTYVPSFANMTFGFGSGLSKMTGQTNTSSNGGDWGYSFGFLDDATLRLFYFSGGYQSVASATTFATNTWHHIMFDHRNSDGRIRIGANGTFLSEATRVGAGPGSQTFFSIGSVRLNQPNYYVDELRVSHTLRY